MKDTSLEQLLEAGSHFGHQKRRWNPAMKDYIFGERDGVHVFDLVKTRDGLLAACEFAKKVTREGGKILFVGTKRQAAEIVKSQAIRAGMPYVSVRWMGGLLTNYGQLSKSIKKLADLKAKKIAGELKKYTKKEQLLIDREIAKLEKFFTGVIDLGGLPQALFVVDTHKEDVAVSEAVKTGVPVIGMVDTNADPHKVDYVIAANDDAVKSIELVVEAITEAVIEGRKAGEKAEAEKKAEVEAGEVTAAAVISAPAELIEETEKKVEVEPETKTKSKLKVGLKVKAEKKETK